MKILKCDKVFFCVCLSLAFSLSAPVVVFGSTCVWDTAQCGGKNYTGLKNCCNSKSVCIKINDYYSKCIPSTSSCSNKEDSQCGGLNFKGNKCCPSGLTCTYRNEWFSKCMKPAGPTPKPTTSSCSNKLDSQCGGLNFKGNTCCPSGLTCTFRNKWFSKCMASTGPTPKPTTSSCSNKTDSQCGGKTFTGQRCCPSPLKCTYRNEWFSKCMAASSPTPSPTTSKPVTSKPSTPPPKPDSACPSGSVSTIYKYNLGLYFYGQDNGVCDKDVTVCCPASCGSCDTSSTCLTTSSKPECCAAKAVQNSCITKSAPCLVPQSDDMCIKNPCKNGGTCKSSYYNTYDQNNVGKCTPNKTCFCPAPYLGDICEDSCPSGEVKCGAGSGSAGGTDWNNPDSFCCDTKSVCVAINGKYGNSTICVRKDHPTTCSPNSCKNSTACGPASFYGSDTLICTCKAGWGGGLCDEPFSCVRSTEQQCGRINLASQGGFLGDSYCCDKDNECIKFSAPTGLEYTTACWPKVRPANCSSPSACGAHGTCVKRSSQQGDRVFTSPIYGCDCDSGYSGDLCEISYY